MSSSTEQWVSRSGVTVYNKAPWCSEGHLPQRWMSHPSLSNLLTSNRIISQPVPGSSAARSESVDWIACLFWPRWPSVFLPTVPPWGFRMAKLTNPSSLIQTEIFTSTRSLPLSACLSFKVLRGIISLTLHTKSPVERVQGVPVVFALLNSY